MEVFFTNPTDIQVKQGTERFRKDMGDIEALAESIQKTRQILPIIVTREMHLIDGGRRLAACLLKGMQVKCVYEDVVDEFEMRELELEANLHRKDYSPAEIAKAVEELHELWQNRHGEAFPGSDAGHSIRDTAKRLGKSKTYVASNLEIAAMIKAFPELAAATKKTQIQKAAKGLLKLEDAIRNQEKHEEAVKGKSSLFKIYKTDAAEHMQTLSPESINILLTDPLYGIEAHDLAISLGGQTGGLFTSAGFRVEDHKDLSYYLLLAKRSYTFTTKDAHGYVFCAPEHFQTIRQFFVKAGWYAYIKPLIWIKRETGQCNVPHAWPSSCYEMILYIRKEDSRIIKQGQPDWIECKPVGEKERLHQYEKPVALLKELLERVALPGQTLYDPFMGSGSSIQAAHEMKLFAIGCDNADECYAVTLKRMSEV